jgi:hypothetical protein
MIPKEKAEELVNKYLMNTPVGFHIDDAKECALIAVDEIIDIAYWEYMESMGEKEKKYWQEVKQEIINL